MLKAAIRLECANGRFEPLLTMGQLRHFARMCENHSGEASIDNTHFRCMEDKKSNTIFEIFYHEATLIFEPENWTAPDKAQMLDWVNRFKGNSSSDFGKGSLLVFREHLSPLDVYKYLAGRFGPPNGFQTFIKKQNDSDNLIHWDFIIMAGEHRIWFQGGNRDVHVGITGKEMRPTEWVKFARNLKSDFGRCGGEMATVGKQLQKWTIVSNRFSLIADVCAEHHEVLIKNQGIPDFKPPKRTTGRGIKRYVKKIEGIGERASQLFNSSICLSYCQIWCLRIVGHAAIWPGFVVSIPSLNVTPVMTLAR